MPDWWSDLQLAVTASNDFDTFCRCRRVDNFNATIVAPGRPSRRRARRNQAGECGHPMRILILNWRDTAHPRSGGAELYIEEVAKWWARWGHDTTIFSAAVGGVPSDELTADGLRHVRRGTSVTVYRSGRRFYERLLDRGERVDVIVDVINTRPFLAPTWAANAPVVALAYQVADDVWRYQVPRPISSVGKHVLEPRWLRPYAQVPSLTISRSSEASLRSYGFEQVSLLPIGQHVAVQAGSSKAPQPTVVYLGRLARNKRPDHALDAFCLLRQRIPDARFWLIGTGPMEGALRRRYKDESITFFGRVSDTEKTRLLAEAHVLFATSVREGWCLAVSEAAAVGTSAVGYDVPGLRDSVSGCGGLLVAPDVHALADAAANVLAGHHTLTPVVPPNVQPWEDVALAALQYIQVVSKSASSTQSLQKLPRAVLRADGTANGARSRLIDSADGID